MAKEMSLIHDDTRKNWEHQVSDYTVSDVDKVVFKAYLDRAKKVGRIRFESDEPEAVLKKLKLTKGDFFFIVGAALFVDSDINKLSLTKYASNERLTVTYLKNIQARCLN